ncbi:MAG: cupin domain-containing protein [Saprospiraceae bacterium]|nr:cupin domain-containing protein [Saprospiraceae bacterium]
MKEINTSSKSPVVHLDSLDYFAPFAGLKAKLVHTENMTVSLWEIEKDAVLPNHHHVNEQVSIITKGILDFTIGGITTRMEKGMVAVIPANVEHSAIAITDVEVTDIFHPIRADFPPHNG